MLGRYDFTDHVWRELRNVNIKEGLLGATLSVETAGGETLSLDYLPKARAREAYRLAQGLEEQALEERRQRALEAERAKSGTVVIPGEQQQQAPAPTTTANADDPMAKLAKLKQMFESELISEDEYSAKKAEVLASM